MTSIVDNKQTVFIIIFVNEVCDMSVELELCTFVGSKTLVLNIEIVLFPQNLAESHDLSMWLDALAIVIIWWTWYLFLGIQVTSFIIPRDKQDRD